MQPRAWAPTATELALIPRQILPAYETAAEAATALKADAADDFRAANPAWFAQTRPPKPGRFRPYGEWETMQAVWTTYSNGMPASKAVRRMMAEQTIQFVRESTTPIKAYAIVNNAAVGADFMSALTQYGITASEKQQVQTVILPNQTIWLMDYSGFPLVDKQTGQVAFADWIYYQARQLDDALGTRVPTQFYDGTAYRVPFPFEGGNIQADGVGQCATTLRALQNTGYSAQKVRDTLKQWSACNYTYILQDISDDGTGHLDMFFKWLAPNHVLISKYEDSLTLDYNGDGGAETLALPGKVASDYKATWALNQKRMEANVKLFQQAKTSAGGSFKISRLTMMTRFKDQYGNTPRTFINSTFTNGVNVYPSYTTKSCRAKSGVSCMTDAACPTGQHCAAGTCTTGPTTRGCDELLGCQSGEFCALDPFKVALTARAQKQWQTAMPKMKHVGLRADSIALWSGAIHCITRTIPKGPITKTVADGLCVQGSCGCSEGGANRSCTDHKQCTGPAWVCSCQLCKGACKGTNTACTHDADCASGGQVTPGACVIDPKQACGKGSTGSSGGGSNGGCGAVSYEGQCNGKVLSFCDGTLKKSTCAECCGWDGANSYYDCLKGAACNTCTNECAAVGQKGCSAQGTHAWTCAKVGGCLKRQWNLCPGTCKQGSCGSGKMVSTCPTSGVDGGASDGGGSGADTTGGGTSDAGSPDTGSPDTGSPDTGSPGTGSGDAASWDTSGGRTATDTGPTRQPDTTNGVDTAAADISTAADTLNAGRGAQDSSALTDDTTAATSADGLAGGADAGIPATYVTTGGVTPGCSATPARRPAPFAGFAILCLVASAVVRRRRA